MDIFLHILWNNVLPLSLIIGLGILLHRIFTLDIKTLSKLNFYLFSPAIMFQLLYGTAISASLFGQVLLFFLVFMLAQYALLELVIRLRKYDGGKKAAMRNSVLFYNSANYGIPINQLAFAGNTYTLSVQVIIMMMQSLIPNTYGIYAVNAHKADWRHIRKVILSMPVIYVIPIALAMRGFHVPLPGFLDISVGYLANAFIGMALFTLGVQLGSMKGGISRRLAVDVSIATSLRLLAGPMLAWGVVLLFDLNAMLSAALIVSSAVPTSLSSVLLAVEFDNEQDFASQSVLVSTALSIVTVTAVIYLLRVS
ncbi:AEC family transporter [Cohnella endophytica]|uniref:AEC family transporter n=1 Tax=Cohnella endophytica TaxID=2419778 RepID=A0A494Y7A0_9BACL|nr:AEC family transporter [Cohnella endophytica]RKP57415.1 AEC family transporter [Cohnella endophytica]